MAQLTIQQAFDLALQHHQTGRLAEAEAIYRQILAGHPNHPDALHLLGVIAVETGRLDMAIELLRRAVAANPGIAEFHNSLGNALNEKKLFDEAITALRRAIQIKSAYAEAQNNLGISLRGKGLLDDAVAAYRQVIALRPNYPEAHSNLGNALRDKEQFDEAIAAYRRAIALNPNLPEVQSNLGMALRNKGQLDEAIAAYHQAIAFRPNYPEVHSNLGVALRDQGQLDEAIAAYRRAIALRPNYPEAHHNLALALLARGDFQQGWDEHEWRWKCEDLSSLRRNFTQPQWDGRTLEGRTVLLHTEQGFGDALQFIRYVPLVGQRGGNIIIGCQAELQRLFQTVAGKCQIVVPGQPLPPFDFHCPLLSLPRVFGTTLANIPKMTPYLSAEPALVEAWDRTLGPPDGQLRVGLAWAGSSRFKRDRTRSLNLHQLAPFADARGVTFYSLQKGPAGEQAKNPPAGMELIDLGPKLNDFADTAAVMSLMDLIITTDTSVPHLAGALARPVWVMLQFTPDWRWMLERKDSPWYPSMQLFRQPSWGDWDGVIARVVDALTLRIKNRV